MLAARPLAALTLALAAVPAAAQVTAKVNPASPTGGIQEAIDALPPNGGVVVLPPGTYLLRQAVVLHNHVTLRGAGGRTILTRGRPREVMPRLRDCAKPWRTSGKV